MAKKKQILRMPDFDVDSASMPKDLESEAYVIGALLSDIPLSLDRDSILSQSDDLFTDEGMREIFRAAKRLRQEGKATEKGAIYNSMIHNNATISVYENIIREKEGGSWEFDLSKIEDRIRFDLELRSLSFMDSGSGVSFKIEQLKVLQAKRAALKSATLLGNIEKIGQENVLTYISAIQSELELSLSKNNASLFAPDTDEEIAEEMKDEHEGIGTNYYVFSDNDRKEIKIPRGQISLICGLPGHGKSTFLLNIALRLAHTQREGKIIYLTYEESKKRTIPKIISLAYGKSLNKSNVTYGGNIDRIREYYKDKTDYIADVAGLKEAISKINDMRKSGKLKIVSPDCSSLDIVSALRSYLSESKENITAVFVDYIQYLNSGRGLDTLSDIYQVAKDFLDFAKETNIPVIAAAQLNREAENPEKMGGKNIADSANLTRLADTIICLWNSTKEDDVKEAEKYKSKSHYLERLNKFGFEFGKGGKIYVKVTKARDIESGADAVYDFNGSTKVIGRAPFLSSDLIDDPNPDNTKENPIRSVLRDNVSLMEKYQKSKR